MPFAPVSNPDLAAQLMFQGISQAGQALGGGINQALQGLADQRERDKQLNQVAKASEAMFKASPELQKRLGLTPEQFSALDAHTKIGNVSGAIASVHNDVVAEQLRAAKEQNALLQQEAANAKVQPQFMSAVERYLSPTGNYEEASQTPEGRAAMIAGTAPAGPMTPLRAVSKAAAETGYTIRPGQLDDVLRALKYSQPAALPEGFTPTKATVGGITYEAPAAPVSVPPGFSPTQIVIGDDGKPRYTLEPTPQSPQIPPGMQPKTVTVDTKGRPTVTYAEPDAAKKLASDYPWLLDDDVEKFKSGLRAIKDPAERNAVIETRNRYESALGRPSLLERFLMGEAGPAKAAPTTPGTQQAAPETKQPAKAAEQKAQKPTTQLPPGRLRVISPDGRIGLIPAEQLADALNAGYRQLE